MYSLDICLLGPGHNVRSDSVRLNNYMCLVTNSEPRWPMIVYGGQPCITARHYCCLPVFRDTCYMGEWQGVRGQQPIAVSHVVFAFSYPGLTRQFDWVICKSRLSYEFVQVIISSNAQLGWPQCGSDFV